MQKMLDNHLSVNTKRYIKIYEEFEEKIKREYKVVKIKKSSQQYIEEHEKRMKRLRGG